MGVSEGRWWLSTNLGPLHPHPNGKHVSWSVLCGVMLFGLGLISLLTGHAASHLESYSHTLRHRTFFSTLDGSDLLPIDIWKSQYSKYYYGCKERGRHYARE